SHTRWATHGLPSDANAHPHLDRSGKLALVHNGIIENYAELRHKLLRLKHGFLSQTDTEVLAHWVGHHLDRLARGKRLTPELVTAALRSATNDATGTYAIAVMHVDLPGHLFGARRGSPLVVGIGEGENFLGSDISPIASHARKVIYLHDGDVVHITESGVSVTANGREARRTVAPVQWPPESAEKGDY